MGWVTGGGGGVGGGVGGLERGFFERVCPALPSPLSVLVNASLTVLWPQQSSLNFVS